VHLRPSGTRSPCSDPHLGPDSATPCCVRSARVGLGKGISTFTGHLRRVRSRLFYHTNSSASEHDGDERRADVPGKMTSVFGQSATWITDRLQTLSRQGSGRASFRTSLGLGAIEGGASGTSAVNGAGSVKSQSSHSLRQSIDGQIEVGAVLKTNSPEEVLDVCRTMGLPTLNKNGKADIVREEEGEEKLSGRIPLMMYIYVTRVLLLAVMEVMPHLYMRCAFVRRDVSPHRLVIFVEAILNSGAFRWTGPGRVPALPPAVLPRR
jgi:hypothetical protein